MPTLPTSSERTDTALTLAKTRAAAYADAGNMQSAYSALLRGVRSAQRANSSSTVRTTLAGLWAIPAMKAGALAGTIAIAAAVARSKSRGGSDATSSELSASPTDVPARPGRLRRRPRPTDHAAVVTEPTVPSTLDD